MERQQLNATHDPQLDFIQLFKKKKTKTVGCAVWHMGSWFLEAMTPALETWDLNHWTSRRNPGFLIEAQK